LKTLSTPTRLALAAVAFGVALTACSPLKAGAAAIVGPERITTAEVEERVQEVNKALAAVPGGAQQLQMPVAQAVLLQMVEMERYTQLGRQNGVTVNDSEVDGFIQAQQGGFRQVEQTLLVNGIPPSQALAYIRSYITAQKIAAKLGGGTDEAAMQRGNQALFQQYSAMKVTFNPRFGKFDPQQGFVANDRFGAPPAPAQPDQQQQIPQGGG
jgi:hypothetical protein